MAPAAPTARTVAHLADAVERRSAGRLKAVLVGNGDRVVARVAPLESADTTALSFLANPRYRAVALASSAGSIVLKPADRAQIFAAALPNATLIESDAPYAWFAVAAQLLAPEQLFRPGIDASAVVDVTARIDPEACIEANAVIESGATVGARCRIGAGCFIGEGASIGPDSRLYPGARVQPKCVIGARAIVHGGAVIGADGFGFASLDGRWIKIPQTGRVVIGDDVEIGANTTIDRGTMGDTVIEDGVKIDNQVQVAHNCRIGAHTVIAGCVGIAGSATIGRGCQLGGAAMVAGHLSIADDAIVGGGTLVSRSISEAGYYSGSFPLMKHRDWERNAAALRHLDELRDRIRALESQLKTKGES